MPVVYGFITSSGGAHSFVPWYYIYSIYYIDIYILYMYTSYNIIYRAPGVTNGNNHLLLKAAVHCWVQGTVGSQLCAVILYISYILYRYLSIIYIYIFIYYLIYIYIYIYIILYIKQKNHKRQQLLSPPSCSSLVGRLSWLAVLCYFTQGVNADRLFYVTSPREWTLIGCFMLLHPGSKRWSAVLRYFTQGVNADWLFYVTSPRE